MDAQLQFQINNQTIKRTDKFKVVAKSHDYLFAHFEFATDEWQGITKTAIFATAESNYAAVLDESDTCEVPWETLAENGYITVSIFGGSLITVNRAKIYIEPTGYVDSSEIENSQEPTQDIYEQVTHYLDGVREDVHADAEAAAASAASASESEQNIRDMLDRIGESEESARNSALAAALSESNARASASTALQAEQSAIAKADEAAQSAQSANASNESAALYAEQAETSAQNAKASEDIVVERAARVEEVFQTIQKYDGGTFNDWEEG